MNVKRYPEIIEKAREAGRKCGYAIAVHGSEMRDLDLIAVPWTDEATDPMTLVRSISRAIGALQGPGYWWSDEYISDGEGKDGNPWTEKPHGRRACVLLVAGGYIDLSVMPRQAPTP